MCTIIEKNTIPQNLGLVTNGTVNTSNITRGTVWIMSRLF